LGGAQKTNAAISVATCGVLLIANFAFTQRLGLLGACLSVVLAAAAWTGLSALMLARHMNIGASLLFVLRRASAKKYATREILHLMEKRRSALPDALPLQIDR
jgi:hypothetical protein